LNNKGVNLNDIKYENIGLNSNNIKNPEDACFIDLGSATLNFTLND